MMSFPPSTSLTPHYWAFCCYRQTLSSPALPLAVTDTTRAARVSLASSCNRLGTDFITGYRGTRTCALVLKSSFQTRKTSLVWPEERDSREEVGWQGTKRQKKFLLSLIVSITIEKKSCLYKNTFRRPVPVVCFCWQICLDKLAF